jgi:hypothetical protein
MSARKVTPEMAEEMRRLRRQHVENRDMPALIKRKFGVVVSATTCQRHILGEIAATKPQQGDLLNDLRRRGPRRAKAEPPASIAQRIATGVWNFLTRMRRITIQARDRG